MPVDANVGAIVDKLYKALENKNLDEALACLSLIHI